MKITNDTTGQTIHLVETDNIGKLECQLILLGTNGLGYSPWAKDIRDKIKRLNTTQTEEGASK